MTTDISTTVPRRFAPHVKPCRSCKRLVIVPGHTLPAELAAELAAHGIPTSASPTAFRCGPCDRIARAKRRNRRRSVPQTMRVAA